MNSYYCSSGFKLISLSFLLWRLASLVTVLTPSQSVFKVYRRSKTEKGEKICQWNSTYISVLSNPFLVAVQGLVHLLSQMPKFRRSVFTNSAFLCCVLQELLISSQHLLCNNLQSFNLNGCKKINQNFFAKLLSGQLVHSWSFWMGYPISAFHLPLLSVMRFLGCSLSRYLWIAALLFSVLTGPPVCYYLSL